MENSYFSNNLARSVDINQLEADGTDENVVTAILNDPSSVSGSGGAIALNLDTTEGARSVVLSVSCCFLNKKAAGSMHSSRMRTARLR